jgi:hypothetical protein
MNICVCVCTEVDYNSAFQSTLGCKLYIMLDRLLAKCFIELVPVMRRLILAECFIELIPVIRQLILAECFIELNWSRSCVG